MERKYYTKREIVDMLDKAEAMGFPLGRGSYVEKLTLHQLDELVNKRKHDA